MRGADRDPLDYAKIARLERELGITSEVDDGPLYRVPPVREDLPKGPNTFPVPLPVPQPHKDPPPPPPEAARAPMFARCTGCGNHVPAGAIACTHCGRQEFYTEEAW